MCTVVLRLAPAAPYPLLLAANRDEFLDRAADPPAAWWPDQPDVVGGRDRLAGGTWLALRADGFVAAVLNRQDSLGPAAGFKSRGLLPLLALRHPTPQQAAAALLPHTASYRPFNLVLANRASAWFLRGGANPAAYALPEGLSMITAHDPNDPASPRIRRHLPRLRAVPEPSPPDWSGWAEILADRAGPPQAQMTITPIAGFGTVSTCRLALPLAAPPLLTVAPPAKTP